MVNIKNLLIKHDYLNATHDFLRHLVVGDHGEYSAFLLVLAVVLGPGRGAKGLCKHNHSYYLGIKKNHR